jgi:hypothetical protein
MENHEPENEDPRLAMWGYTQPKIRPDTIRKAVRSWAIVFSILGILIILPFGFNNLPWGILFLIIGISSFYIRSSAMMAVYAVIFTWAGISNILATGTVFGFYILLWILALLIFNKFIIFKNAEEIFTEDESGSSGLTPQRAVNIFPWASAAFGILSILSTIVLSTTTIHVSGLITRIMPGYWIFNDLSADFGVLGFALGLASLICKYPRKALVIVGMVAGFLNLIFEYVL